MPIMTGSLYALDGRQQLRQRALELRRAGKLEFPCVLPQAAQPDRQPGQLPDQNIIDRRASGMQSGSERRFPDVTGDRSPALGRA